MGTPYATLAVALIVLVTSAGACRQQLDGPVPTPIEYGAEALPAGSTTSGVDAVYVRPVGEQCDRLVRLRPDGTALTVERCFVSDVAAWASDAGTWTVEQAGDYAYRDGRLVVRVVEWEPIAAELVLHEWDVSYCATGLQGEERQPPRGPVTVEYELLTGSAPPDAAPCPLG